MKINHVIGTSFIDYPGEIAMVVFTKGCNMSCPYCHNKDLESQSSFHDETEIFAFLEKRRGLVDGIVISGGEPTCHKGLEGFCEKLKAMDIKVKLDTNGTHPDILKTLIERKLVDYIAMDFKTSPEQYEALCGIPFSAVEESVALIKQMPAYEFRTTVYPTITTSDIESIIAYTGRDHYFLQQYRPNSGFERPAYEDDLILAFGQQLGVSVRGVERIMRD
ncbi:MAG: anaerobic ribonucleoside-triphosphate reductase activating protein, partial [Clostridia bacterium]|nr:anaerobic ribonucleoside-triphosphate reductase activating protein [Clostridia bacterium]